MRIAFKIPLQSEVEMYIKEKTGWPNEFVKYYSEKFWNHYQASGWKLSSGNSIKDWRACFNSQWKVPKYKEDIEMLYGKQSGNYKTTPAIVKKMEPTTQIEKLDAFLRKYQERPTEVPFSDFGQWYDFMKSEKLLKPLTKGEVNNLLSIYNGDNGKCRCACVQMTLDGYVMGGFTFDKVYEIRKRLA